MKIIVEHMIKVARNLEEKVNKLTYDIDTLDMVRDELKDEITIDVHELNICREQLDTLRRKFIKMAEVMYVTLNYYVRCDEENAQNCYDDKIVYPDKKKSIIDLNEVMYILNSTEF